MSFFSKSRRDLALIVFLSALAITISAQVFISFSLNKFKRKTISYLTNKFPAYRFKIDEAKFSVWQGLHIKGISISCEKPIETPFIIKEVFASVKILPLIFQRTIAIQMHARDVRILTAKEKEGINVQIIFSDLYKGAPQINYKIFGIFRVKLIFTSENIHITYKENTGINNDINVVLKNLNFVQDAERFRFNSDIQVNYLLRHDAYLSRFFQDQNIIEKFNCSAQGKILRDNLIIDLILINIGKDQIIGSGINHDFAAKNPLLDLNFMQSTLNLSNISTLKNNFSAEGNAFFSFKLYGPMNNTKIKADGNLHYCQFDFPLSGGEFCNIKNLGADLSFRDNRIKFEKVYLEINTIPLNFDLNGVLLNEPYIELEAFIPKDYLKKQNLPIEDLELNFKGTLKNTLRGDLFINLLYLRKESPIKMRAYFQNIEFDYNAMKDKKFFAETIELTKNSAADTQRLNFNQFLSIINIYKNKIEANTISFSGYNAIINGQSSLKAGDKTHLQLNLEGKGIDVKTLMQDTNISDKLLSGSIDLSLLFDNQKKFFVEGKCDITKGAVNLELVADMLKLPALKKIGFDRITGSIFISKTAMRYDKVEMTSPEVLLNAQWETNGKIDGVLNLQIASEVLNQSTPFKKLLRLTRINKPFIDFSFLLGGLSRTPRVMWATGEFKEKIKQDLPKWVKIRIERDLDKIIDDLSK